MRGFVPLFLGCAAVLAASAPGRAQVTPLLQYTFDEPSGAALDTGTPPPADGTLQGGAVRTTNTPSGSGFAVDLITNEATGGYAHVNTAGDVPKLDGLGQFTLSTWINLDDPGSGSDRLMSKQAGDSPLFSGFMWNINNPTAGGTRANGDVNSGLFVGGSTGFAFATSDADVNLLDHWVFLAVSYDGTLAADNTRFYVGDLDSPVTQLGSVRTINAGTTADADTRFGVGFTDAAPTADTSANGLYDDVRVYGSALDATALDAVRLQNVPEPASLLGVMLLGGMALARGGRRRCAH
jgi:hypothetical protein